MKLVDAEPIHVVIYFDNFLALCTPITLDLLPEDNLLRIICLIIADSTGDYIQVWFINFEHVLGVQKRPENEDNLIKRNTTLLERLTNACNV